MKKYKKVDAIAIPGLDQTLANTSESSKNFISKSFDVAQQISMLLAEKNISQRGLAQKLNKAEAEISKWLSGTHNLTLRTITAIETALDAEIIVTPQRIRKNVFKYSTHVYRATPNAKNTTPATPESYRIKSSINTGATSLKVA